MPAPLKFFSLKAKIRIAGLCDNPGKQFLPFLTILWNFLTFSSESFYPIVLIDLFSFLK